jgi:hypothetical protein
LEFPQPFRILAEHRANHEGGGMVCVTCGGCDTYTPDTPTSAILTYPLRVTRRPTSLRVTDGTRDELKDPHRRSCSAGAQTP